MKQFTDKLPSGLILIIKAIMKVIYAFMKILVKQKNNRVLFMSRQANELSIDFRLLKKNIEQNHSEVEIRYICKRFDDSGKNKITFAVSMIKSMYYLATAKVCVIDAYIPTISILKHKKSLVVIQMWHSIGKIKQSGYQTLGKEGGRDKIKAQLLDMHKNYDYVIAGGSAWNEFYCKSFNIAEDKIINIGLPRIDYLLSTKESNKKKFYKYYPEFTEKIIVLYAPTFRRDFEVNYEDLKRCFSDDRFAFIVKKHSNQQSKIKFNDVTCSNLSTLEVLSACDYLITDYSAIAIEGAVLDKKTLYYVPDYDKYMNTNGLNIDPLKEMPSISFKNAKSVFEVIENDSYNIKEFNGYKKKYLPKELGKSTEKLTALILANLG